MREILELTVGGCRLAGTCHLSPDRDAEANGARMGLLLLNSGFLPRAPVGDLTVRMADHFSGMGYPSFRFDMPGLGDSNGELPADVTTFFASVLNGEHGESAATVVQELVKRYILKGMVVGGLCGGAVTSVYAAATENGSAISGVLLLDPSFQITNPAPQDKPEQPAAAKLVSSLRSKPKEWYRRMRLKVLGTKAGMKAKGVYLKVKPAFLWVRRSWNAMKGEPLPSDANEKLIGATKGVCSRGVPMLALMAGAENYHTEKYDYLKHIAKGQRGNFDYRYLEDTTHSFVEGNGEAVVTSQIEEWLKGHWPVGKAPVSNN